MRLEAEGPLDATGALVAVRISFRSSIKIEADASAVTAGGLTVLGKAVAINPLTRGENGPIANGDHLEIRASLDRDGNLVATRIVKQAASTRVFLQAPVTAKDAVAGTLTMLGITLTTNSQTELRKSTDVNDTAVDSATFFAQITPNVTVVKVRWDAFSSLTLPVKQAEIELGK